MALASVELETLVSEPDALTARPSFNYFAQDAETIAAISLNLIIYLVQ